MWEHPAKIKGIFMPEKHTVAQAVSGLLRSFTAHGWAIMRFRHHGQGLGLAELTLLMLGLLAVASVCATAYIAPTSGAVHHPLMVGALTAGIFAACFIFCGRAGVAGFIITTILTEPVSIALRLAGLGDVVDPVFTLWVLAAQLVFFFRAAGAEHRV